MFESISAIISVLPRLEDFASRVRLLKGNSEKEWVNELFAAATAKFYKEGDLECLYYQAKIHELICARITDLTPPSPSLASILIPKNWERKSEERITLGTTQFEKYDEERGLWMTEVKSATAFAGKDVLDLPHEEIRVSSFLVRWSSAVSDSAEISDSRLESVEFKDRQMFADTKEERTKWSLTPKPPELGLNWFDFLKSPPTTSPSSM